MKLFSKIAFICNISFVVFIILGYIEFNNKKNKAGGDIMPLPFLTGMFVILGQFAIFINFIFCLIALIMLLSKKMKQRVHPKLSLAGGDTSQGRQPCSVSPPTTAIKQQRQFGMHPKQIPQWLVITNFIFLLLQVYYFFIY